MWRALHLVGLKGRVPQVVKLPGCSYATSPSGKGKKGFITLIAVASIGTGVTIAYAKYDPKFRKIIEENIPYADVVFNSIPDWESKSPVEPKSPTVSDQKARETAIESGLLKKKQERQRREERPYGIESSSQDSGKQPEVKPETPSMPKTVVGKSPAPSVNESEKHLQNKISEVKSEPHSMAKPVTVGKSPAPSVNESEKHIQNEISAGSSVKDLVAALEKGAKEVVTASDAAVSAIKLHTEKLYQALDSPEGVEADECWKQAELAGSREMELLKAAHEKVACTRALIEELKTEIQKSGGSGSKSPMLAAEEVVHKTEKQLAEAETKVAAAHSKSKSAAEYKDLVKKARDQFKNELQIVLPKYVHRGKDQTMTEDELNLLIAHAHRRIENLQKELARHQVREKQRIEEAKMLQTKEGDKSSETKTGSELDQQNVEDFQKQLEMIREQFEADMRQQLRRQAAVHADHLQESLHIQQQELTRRQKMELEEKLLQQKGTFISQISESMSRLKGIENYLKARAELDEATRKAQALWLACQAMKNTIRSGFSEAPKPLGKELAMLKAASGEGSSFISTVLAGIPIQAIQRGVYTDEHLKQRFEKVKRVCRRVAMITDENRSLYHYLLSFLQSFLIIDTVNIPKEELDGEVDTSQLDTFEILSRISYCLQRNDMERALLYATKLKGEPGNVASDWIAEVRLLLETAQAVDCLITYAAAVGVQAYH